MLFRPIALLTALVIGGISQTAKADDFVDFEPLLKELVGAHPGRELVVPLFTAIDNNFDGYPERIAVKFRVFRTDTGAWLFATKLRSLYTPAIPCVNPLWVDEETEVEFVGKDDVQTGVGINLVVVCAETNGGEIKEAYKTFFFMANTAVAGTPVWARQWNMDSISFELVDGDSDGQEEVVVIMAKETNSGEDARVVMLNKANGTTEFDKTYQIVSDP